MDGRVAVDLGDHVQQFLLSHLLGQEEGAHSHPRLLASLQGPPFIGQVLRPLPHPDDGQGGGHPIGPQGGGLVGHPLGQGGRCRRTLPKLGHHANLPMTAW